IKSQSKHLTTRLSKGSRAIPLFTVERGPGPIRVASVSVVARLEQSLVASYQPIVSFRDLKTSFLRRLSWIDSMMPRGESWFISRIRKRQAGRTILIQFRSSW
ncbi:hypothetical protein LCGC14_3108400, partial [marine sediment metagenome]